MEFEPPQHRKHITAHDRAARRGEATFGRIEGRQDPSTSPITVQGVAELNLREGCLCRVRRRLFWAGHLGI